ncbi:P2X purinoceptor 1 isoform X1 [Lepisosteus oculatus]|uniref:P2X purinoceptor 1 isoform X1 n=2 Tax=Lepisosteus oculatus TaxID=7918 RepID=UPI003712FD28
MKTYLSQALSDFFFEYETPRQVLVKDRRIGVVCRLIQLCVLVYIIGWVFIYEKGYQSTDTALSSVFTKMKGIAYTNESGERIWDVGDYVFPQHGSSSFVVMTNFIMTAGQKLGYCEEPNDMYKCKSDSDCQKGDYKRTGHGQKTGRCNQTTNACEIFAWCPVENDHYIPDPPLLLSAENFTLFIKNSVTFPVFDVIRSNLVEEVDSSYLANCTYHKTKDPVCPIFRLGDIVEMSGFTFKELAQGGGAIGILIEWTCNLDWAERYCRPLYHFYGLYGNGKVSKGYNFRYAKYYMEDKSEKRTITKVFGIRFDIIVRSLARKFDIIPTLTTIGSGVGIFGVATVVCDLMLLYILPKRDFFKNMKFKYTIDHGEGQTLHPEKKQKEDEKER